MSSATPGTDPLWDHLADHPVARGWLRVRAADRAHPQVLDGFVATFVLLIGLVDLFRNGEYRSLFGLNTEPTWVLALTAAAQALPLVRRRRAPLTVFWVVLAVCALQWALGFALRSDLSLMIVLYGVARYAPPRRLPWVAAAVLPCITVLAWRVEPLSRRPWTGLFFMACAATAAAALGLAARIRQAQLAALADRAATLEVEREQRERLATADERARVSRELHDIVGHSLAVIIGLADGGAAQAELRPERGPEVLRIIAETGRESLGELRRTLGALRAEVPDDAAPGSATPGHQVGGPVVGGPVAGGAIGGAELHPQPGTAELGVLCERLRAAGPTVTYTASGHTAALPPGLQLAVYRIVQEALTNSLKHAGPGTDVRVSVAADLRAAEVRVRVDDSGGEPETTPAAGSGHGLIGLRERAALAGGSVTAGPRPGGGWSVAAILPMPLPDDPSEAEEEDR
ncbi:sensor histidine kinase [Streptacidiphilus jiangxiensis]|uniref:histidine kinase n=1 Tax=Streptacidiphilus jiangxiensis TaxID=235985 RepID=A0A1H7PX74_STRJI|nr:histidine kinase [Streptacidiphilus jiangxiensis]SEL40333.1 Signal transduction histidine kinase [Streptacidiphilus jiangxiensis]